MTPIVAQTSATRPSLRILIVEDDRALADGISAALRNDGYTVDVLDRGELAIAAIERESSDLLILDIGLPGIDGFEALRRVRAAGHGIPVLLLTARDALEDRVHGLETGADDYLVKPFAILELSARVRALVRRGRLLKGPRLTHGPLVLDQQSRRATLNETPLELAAREWSVLEILMMQVERVVSKRAIIQSVAGWDEELSHNAIEVYVSRLRAKLEPAGICIRTVRGLGYMLEEMKSE